MRKAFKNRSVFFYFVLYNLIILTIPLMLNVVWYKRAEKLVKDKTTEVADTVLTRSQSVIDERIRRIKSNAVNISLNTDVRRYADYADPKSAKSIYAYTTIDKTLQKYISLDSYTEMIFIYYGNSNTVLSSTGGILSPREFYRLNGKLLGDEAEWEKALGGENSDVFVRGGESSIIYFMNILPSKAANGSDKIGICLNRSLVSDVFSSSALPDSSLSLIADNAGNVLYTDGDASLAPLFGKAQGSAANRIVKSADGTRYMVSHTASDGTGLCYVFITPCSVYMKHSNNFRILTYVIIAFGFALGLLLSLHFARKSARPIVEMSKIIDVDLSGNELLDNSLPWRSIESDVRRRLHSADDLQLHKLLFPDSLIPEESLSDELQRAFPHRRFVCAVIDLFGVPEYMEDVPSDEIRYVLNNVACDVCRMAGSVRVICYEARSYVAVLNVSDEMHDADTEIAAFFAMLREIMYSQLEIDTFISVGNIHESTKGIAPSFAEARKIRECMPILRGCGIICFKDFKNIRPYDYPIALELELIGFIKQGNGEKASAALGEILKRNFARPDFTVSMAKSLIMQIQNTLVNTLADLGLTFDDVFGSGKSPFDALSVPVSYDEAATVLGEAFRTVCDCVSGTKSTANQGKIEKIIEYIYQNYQNPSLSLCMISDRFHMNQAYLSTFFREQTGEKLINFIRKIKIDKAKALLRETSLPLRSIAEQTGYNSSAILIQNFKRETGLSPTQYRTQVQAEE